MRNNRMICGIRKKSIKFVGFLMLAIVVTILAKGKFTTVLASTGIDASIIVRSDSVVISGTIAAGANKLVSIRITPPGSENIDFFIKQKASSSGGKYEFRCEMMDIDPTGEYKVMMGGEGISNPLVTSFYYASKNTREQVVASINNAGTAADVIAVMDDTTRIRDLQVMGINMDRYNNLGSFKSKACEIISNGNLKQPDGGIISKPFTQATFITIANQAIALAGINSAEGASRLHDKILENNDLLQLEIAADSYYGKLEESVKTLALTQLNGKKDYKEILEFRINFRDTVLLFTINYTNWGEMEEILTANNGILQLNFTGSYRSLTEENKIRLFKMLADITFTGCDVIKDDFNRLVAQLLEQQNAGGTGSNGGGGGSSRGSSTTINMPLYLADPNMNASSSAFVDISTVPWAVESINVLAEKGIVAGYDNGQFKPNDNVKREEFIRMVVSAFSLTEEADDCSFTDVNKGEWYYKYIAGAQKHGITNGLDGGSFGIGREITRQEMAVLIFRMSKFVNIPMTSVNSDIRFNDDSDISDYARESIYSLQKAGIISGVGENRFEPYNAATRAEAAKMIYTLLQKSN